MAGRCAAALGRRGFLFTGASACGGLLVGVGPPMRAEAAIPRDQYPVTAWVSVGADESVTILCGSQDMGQGIYSGLAQILAEELRCDWARVGVGPSPVGAQFANPLLGTQMTAASSSVRGFFKPLLEAGAIARQMLIEAGAAVLHAKPGDCIAAAGFVVVEATGASVSFGTVAQAASQLTPPHHAKLYSANGYTLVGQSVPRPEIPSKVNGAAVYGMDVTIPGMVFGALQLCPTRGGTVAHAGRAPYGTKLVDLGTGIAAVMQPGPNNTTWAAMQAARQVKVKWTLPLDAGSQTTATILALAEQLLADGTGVIAQTKGDAGGEQVKAATVLRFVYILPYLPHTTMETPNCTANVTANSCELWAATQAPAGAQAAAAAITGLDPSAVTVNCVQMGGGLGRKLEQDFVSYAVMASKALGLPVQMVFSREQDFTQDQYRPMAVCGVTIGLDKHGGIVSWVYRNVSPSILYQRGYIQDGQLDDQASEGSTALPYALHAVSVDWVRHPATIPVGFWRSVGNSINVFAVESAMDEVAAATGVDPLLFRQRLLAHAPRPLAVLNAAASLAGWSTPPPAGHARGIAMGGSFGSLVALVAEVTSVAGTIQLVTIACAVDCGFVINPDTAAQQVEGGIVQGMGSALWGQIAFSKGVAQTANFDAYKMLRMADMPTVQVVLLQEAGAPIGGLGEVGVPCVAPALANAWAALTGTRLRQLPLFPVQF